MLAIAAVLLGQATSTSSVEKPVSFPAQNRLLAKLAPMRRAVVKQVAPPTLPPEEGSR